MGNRLARFGFPDIKLLDKLLDSEFASVSSVLLLEDSTSLAVILTARPSLSYLRLKMLYAVYKTSPSAYGLEMNPSSSRKLVIASQYPGCIHVSSSTEGS